VVRILSDELVGKGVYRLIPSRYPTITIFENLLDPSELELAYELESITNDLSLIHISEPTRPS